MDAVGIRVLFVIGALTAGGTEKQLIGILRHLDRRQFKPYLYRFYQNGELVSQIPDDVVDFCDESDESQSKRGFIPGHIHRRLAGRLANYCERHCIDIVYDRTYHVSLVTGHACRSLGLPYVNTIVSDPYTDFWPTAGPFAPLKYLKLRSIYQNASRVLCVSEGLCAAAAKFYHLSQSCFQTCYNFIDAQRMVAIEQARTMRLSLITTPHDSIGSPERPLKVIAVGRLHRQKGIHVLIEALAILMRSGDRHISLQIVGEGPQRRDLQSQVLRSGLTNHVQFLGYIENPELLIASSDLYCLPSLGEGMPNSLIESLLIGVPSIASNCHYGPSEILRDGKWGQLVGVGDSDTIAAAILRFLDTPMKYIHQALQAKDDLVQRFSPQSGIQRLEEQLRSALGR